MAAKDFAKSPKVDADVGETQPGFIQWLMMCSRMARCVYDDFAITSELQNSVWPALGAYLQSFPTASRRKLSQMVF